MRRRTLIAGLAATAGWSAGAGNASESTASDDTASDDTTSDDTTTEGTTAKKRSPPLPALGSALSLPDVLLLDGSRYSAASAAGQVVVVYWWASWCPFCAVQSPHIDRLWRTHRAQGLQVLGLSIDRSAEDATRYLAQRGYSFPSGMVTPAITRVLPQPQGLPVTVVRGREGRVRAAEAGQLFPEDIEQFARFL